MAWISHSVPLNSGIPQGTVDGKTLFPSRLRPRMTAADAVPRRHDEKKDASISYVVCCLFILNRTYYGTYSNLYIYPFLLLYHYLVLL